ncbi:MAG: AAA family ATPase [Actinomycetota bacterium]
MKVVEFVGAPGAGKTRFAWNLIDALPQGEVLDLRHGVHRALKTTAERRATRILLATLPAALGWRAAQRLVHGNEGFVALNRFLLTQDGFLGGVLAAMRERMGSFPDPESYLNWVITLCAKYSIAAHGLADGSIVLIDEGFANRGVGLFAFTSTPNDDVDLRSYARAMPRPDVLVFLDTDRETCRGRLEERGWTKRSRHLSAEDRLAFLDASIVASRTIADELATRGVEVLTVLPGEDGDARHRVGELLTGTLAKKI